MSLPVRIGISEEFAALVLRHFDLIVELRQVLPARLTPSDKGKATGSARKTGSGETEPEIAS
jgi:hypothetical protein